MLCEQRLGTFYFVSQGFSDIPSPIRPTMKNPQAGVFNTNSVAVGYLRPFLSLGVHDRYNGLDGNELAGLIFALPWE